LINELCEHLRQIGIEATVLDFKSPEAVHHTPTMHIIYSMKNIPPLGSVKVDGRNIDLVEVSRFSVGGSSGAGGGGTAGYIVYRYNYIVKTKVGDLEDELKVEVNPIKKGFLTSEIVDYNWEGGELAQLLNADSELKNMLLGLGAPHLMVIPNKKDQYVAIMPIVSSTAIGISDMTVGRKAFPTREAFEAYDIIAQHTRKIPSSQP
jgi:hypothetical protein